VADQEHSAAEPDDAPLGVADGVACPACGGALGLPLIEARDLLLGVPGAFSIACCETCGLGVTLPLAADAQLAEFYSESYGAYSAPLTGVLGLVSRGVQRFLSWHALHSAPLNSLAELPVGRVLDVGCGNGELGSWLARRGWSVVGIEPSEGACAVARERAVDARRGILADMELEPESYDAVVFRHSLEHVTDPVADLRRIRAALRDGGVVIVSVPHFDCWQRRSFGAHWSNLEVPRHRFHFNAASLRTTLAMAGFTRITTRTSTSAIALPASIQYAVTGRFLFGHGLRLRVSIAACGLIIPASWLANQLAGGGDLLHAVAS
jgi:SAM-dependent methyltransferase